MKDAPASIQPSPTTRLTASARIARQRVTRGRPTAGRWLAADAGTAVAWRFAAVDPSKVFRTARCGEATVRPAQ
ncbi:hypothetical protein AB0425_15555 [Actinosynnema sp. NPDC051121]